MTRLDDLLEGQFESPEEQLALDLAREHQHLLARLVEIRRASGLSQEDVAERLGLSQATISSFERIGNDPHLSTLRRYCRAIGVMLTHHVSENALACTRDGSEFVSHVSGDGIDSHDTAAAVARAIVRSDVAWPAASEIVLHEAVAQESMA